MEQKQFFYQPNSDVLLLQPFSQLAVHQWAVGRRHTTTLQKPEQVVLVTPEPCILQTADYKFQP